MITELKDTVELMQSEDYKKRFKAEYYQLEIRLDKLTDIAAECGVTVCKLRSVVDRCDKKVQTILQRQSQ